MAVGARELGRSELIDNTPAEAYWLAVDMMSCWSPMLIDTLSKLSALYLPMSICPACVLLNGTPSYTTDVWAAPKLWSDTVFMPPMPP